MPVRNIFWTAGWDSTFAVVQALREGDSEVQPIYLIDPLRASTDTELQTIKKLRSFIVDKYPEASTRLRPLKTDPIKQEGFDKRLVESFEAIRGRHFIGDQYLWIAQYLKDNELDAVDMCVHASSYGAGTLLVECCGDDKLLSEYFGTDVDDIFGRCRFPVLHVTKLDMQEIAKTEGFLDILSQTWFCHKPLWNKPCGVCITCKDAVTTGMGWRVPFYAKYLGTARNVVRKAKDRLRR